MSKTIELQVEARTPNRVIGVYNNKSIFTLRVYKKKFGELVTKISMFVFTLVIGLTLVLTYRAGSPFFGPLIKVAALLSLICLVGIISKENLNNSL